MFGKVTTVFQSSAEAAFGIIGTNFAEAINSPVLLNAIGLILIFTYVVKKFQSPDNFFEMKNFINLALFFIILSFFNWVIAHPAEYFSYVQATIYFLPDLATEKVIKSFQGLGKMDISQDTLFSSIFTKIWEKSLNVYSTINGEWTWKSWFQPITTFAIKLLLTAIFFLIQILYLFMMFLIVITTLVEITFYSLLAIFIVPTIFFPATRGMAGAYFKKVLSLAFLKPLLILSALFNLLTIEKSAGFLPPNAGEIKAIAEVAEIMIVLCAVSYLNLKFLSKLPEILNAIFGTQGGVEGATSMFQAGTQAAMSGGASLVSAAASTATAGYKAGGGGAGGLVGAAASLATGGVGKAAVGAIAGGINKLANSTSIGGKANNALRKGISVASSAFKR